MRCYLTTALMLTLLAGHLSAQTISFAVVDSITRSPIEYAMVVATDTLSGRLLFDRTDENGHVSLLLSVDTYYRIEANSLGYAPFRGELLTTNVSPDPITIKLSPRVAMLGEILVRDTLPPISYRPDTVTYNARAFYTGKERKLKDLIDRMPGLEVDKDLRVTYRGEDVTTLLVEGKPFFGGDGELALKGLPAGAVGRVQVLEDYKPLGFTLDPGARKKRALNIIIREEMNNVYFGELLAGAGLPDRHLAQADIFRFNRQTNNYLFAGSNNVERELLSMRSMMRLIGGDQLFAEGGFKKFADLSFRLSPPLFARDGKNQLVAFGINRDVSKRSVLDVYGLLPRKTWTGSQTSNSVFQTTGLEENTSSLRRVRQQFGIVRATLTTKLPKDLVLRTSLQLHGTSEEKMATEDYRSNLGDRGTRQENDVADYAGQLKTNIVKRYEAGHLLKINASAQRQREEEGLLLTSDTTFLGSLLSFGDEAPFAFDQQNAPVRTDYGLDYRYHYRLSRKVFLEQGTQVIAMNLDQEVSSSALPTAKQTTAYRALSTYVGTVVKIEETDAVFRLHLDQPYSFRNGERVFSSSYLLPEARLKFRLGPGGHLETRWKSQTEAPSPTQLTAGTLVTSFTTYQLGLTAPRPTLSHGGSVAYRYYNPIKGFGYDLSASFGQRGGPSVTSALEVAGVDRRLQYAVVDVAGQTLGAIIGLRKDLSGGDRLRLNGSWNRREQITFLAGEVIVSPVATLRLRTELKQNVGENLRLAWRLLTERSTFGAADRAGLYNGSLSLDASYDVGQWSLKTDFSGDVFDLTATARYTGRIRASLRYLLKDSPWAFEVIGAAPLAGKNNISFRQSDLFFTSTSTRVFVAFISANVAFQF